MNSRYPRLERWAIPALLALGLGLKLTWLGANELSGDEPFTVYWAQRPLADLFGMLRTENNPPLYFLLMHAWSLLVPMDPAWLRIPSAIFSVLTVWPLYLIGRRIGGITVGITAALLFTLSQHAFHFAHEVRAYSLLVLACTWAVWQLVRLADDPLRHPSQRPATIALLVLANVLATWAHYFGWLMVGLELAMVFAVPSLRPARVKMLAATALTAVCSLPILGILLVRAGTSLGQGTWVSAPGWDEPYNMIMRWSNAPVVAVLFLVVILVAAALRTTRPKLSGIPALWCFAPLIGMFILSFIFPVYLDRYLLFASIGFYLLVAQAASLIPLGKMPGWLIPAGCVVAMAVTFSPWKPSGQNPSRVVAQVQAWRGDRTAVVIQPSWYDLPYAWAVSPAYFSGAAPVEMALRERGVYAVWGSLPPELDSSVASVVHVDAWAALVDPGGKVLRALRSRYVQTDSVEADRKVMVRRFRKR